MTSLRWYYHRLRAMGPAEILHRLEEKRRKVTARHWRHGWGTVARYGQGSIPTIAGLRERIEANDGTLAAAAAHAADRFLNGHYKALGVVWPTLSGKDRFPAGIWRLDPVTGGAWPGSDRYTFDIPYRQERGLGDIKYVWEFNRLQFLQPLAVDALLNGNESALAAIEEAISSWHAANPPFRGLGWNSGIELALRAISLLIATSLCGYRFRTETQRKVREILAAHLIWIARFPSRYSSANNHLIAEAAGLFLIATAMPELAGSAGIAKAAQAVLDEETQKQILRDGVPAEQSPTYGAFTAEFVLLCAFTAEERGVGFPVAVAERLKAFATFIAALAEPDGMVPAIGDDDEGRVLTFGEEERGYAVSVASAISGFYDEGSGSSSCLRGAIFGRGECGRLTDGLRVLREGGYSIATGTVGERRYRLVFDHGPLGYLSIAAHGHADALSVILSLDGRPVLVDPGTYLYHSGGAWRDWFRSTPAHNTLTLDGQSQSTISGAFNWSHKANARLEDAESGPRLCLRAWHDGYLGRFGVRHERIVSQEANGGFAIVDRLVGAKQPLPVSLSFQVAPDLSARVDGSAVTIVDGGTAIMKMTFADASVKVMRGGEPPDCGFVSTSFGHKVPADRIVWAGDVGEAGNKLFLDI